MKTFLTRGAEKNYRSIIQYLTESWSEAVATAFENKVRDFLKVLDSFPEIGYIEFLKNRSDLFPLLNKKGFFTGSGKER